MARKLRLEFPGVIYHLINRGNYRAFVFKTEGARRAFEECVFAACERSGWRLHAFVIMSNHYHLAVETPLGNLVAGMQWLQSTFASRFNKLRNERGHLFQGRYKALLVEAGDALGMLCHYIHLNPVRAGLVSVSRLGIPALELLVSIASQNAACLSASGHRPGGGGRPGRHAGGPALLCGLPWLASRGRPWANPRPMFP